MTVRFCSGSRNSGSDPLGLRPAGTISFLFQFSFFKRKIHFIATEGVRIIVKKGGTRRSRPSQSAASGIVSSSRWIHPIHRRSSSPAVPPSEIDGSAGINLFFKEKNSFYSGRIFKYVLSTSLRDFRRNFNEKCSVAAFLKTLSWSLDSFKWSRWKELKQIARRWWAKGRHPLQQVTEANQSDASQASSLG